MFLIEIELGLESESGSEERDENEGEEGEETESQEGEESDKECKVAVSQCESE